MARNPFLERAAKEGQSSHGKKYERKSAPSLAAQLTPASGALAGAKGDMVRKKGQFPFLIESKSTTDASLSVKLAWLVKISEEAAGKGINPALLMAFVLPDGRPRPNAPTEWVAIPKALFQEMLDQLDHA